MEIVNFTSTGNLSYLHPSIDYSIGETEVPNSLGTDQVIRYAEFANGARYAINMVAASDTRDNLSPRHVLETWGGEMVDAGLGDLLDPETSAISTRIGNGGRQVHLIATSQSTDPSRSRQVTLRDGRTTRLQMGVALSFGTDGTMAIAGASSFTTIICLNCELPMVGGGYFKVRQKGRYGLRLPVDARAALQNTATYFDMFERAMQTMVPRRQAFEVIDAIADNTPVEDRKRETETVGDKIKSIYHMVEAPRYGETLASIRSSVSNWATHTEGNRGSNKLAGFVRRQDRMRKMFAHPAYAELAA